MGPADLEVLLAVEAGLFDHAIRPDQAESFLNDPLHEMVLAFVGAVGVVMASGQVMYHPDKPPAFFMAEVGIRDEWQRRGIAARLCAELMQIAKDRDCEGICVATEGDNVLARALYPSLEARETRDVVVYDWEDRTMDG